ncbi:hypothetical protein [Aequorivita echinoideorum]|uniref:Membrane domain of glycerophosphoryl diester phosphodiesterase n=1 Tax=Aequorivita echinoideorum TaxID=1549647 RepID=A0ABS5S5B1_9FLAO|nr:hypothetical protein [Aequorivita echinoideorum]MBT0608401.1 hypothetical protein [Aequorivita echinoideorum]
MLHKKIELKQRRDVGDMISTYFEFFKKNFKPFLNIFISYNGLFILGFLGVSYLLVTGFVGTFAETSNNFSIANDISSSQMYLVAGFIGLFILIIITAVLNYSLAAVYVIQYQNGEKSTVDKKQVLQMVKANLGKIVLFIVIMIVAYIVLMVVGIIVSIIPVLGTFAYYLMILAFTAWAGLSFMAMIDKNLDVTDSFSEGMTLLKAFFWKSILTNLVIGLLLGILMMVVLMIPGILIGIYAFHSLDSGVDLVNSPVANVIWTLALALLLVLYTLNQSMAQFVNGILYYSIHEENYNELTRKRIDEIGAGE